MSTKGSCHYCGSTEQELRPYGPGGGPVCFGCAMSDPERKAETERNYEVLLNAAEAIGPIATVGTTAGPQPMTVEELQRKARQM